MTLQSLLDDIRDSTVTAAPHMLNVQKKDLDNISAEFNSSHPERLHKYGSVSTEIMVQMMEDLKESPAISYKPQGSGTDD